MQHTLQTRMWLYPKTIWTLWGPAVSYQRSTRAPFQHRRWFDLLAQTLSAISFVHVVLLSTMFFMNTSVPFIKKKVLNNIICFEMKRTNKVSMWIVFVFKYVQYESSRTKRESAGINHTQYNDITAVFTGGNAEKIKITDNARLFVKHQLDDMSTSITYSFMNHWRHLKRPLWSSVSVLPLKLRWPPVDKKETVKWVRWTGHFKGFFAAQMGSLICHQTVFLSSPLCEWSCCPVRGMCLGKGQTKRWGRSRPGFGQHLRWLPNPGGLQKLSRDAYEEGSVTVSLWGCI